jgi:nicotinate-nucleotide adenylyltransferase
LGSALLDGSFCLKRIGIYAGTFDPVHAGHVAFALQAVQAAKLDRVYFLPERRPRAKQQVEHFGHRVAMLKRAFEPHPKLKVMELVDVNFSVARTLPKIREMFADDELVFLFGSDVVPSIADWPNAKNLLKDNEFVIGLRHDDKREDIHRIVESWQSQPKMVTVFESYAPDVSSSKIREALRLRKRAKGTLKSVERYSDHNWLYVSLA